MLIEITSYYLDKETKELHIEGIDMTKTRHKATCGREEVEVSRILLFDTTDKDQFNYITNWLKRQKATKGCKTYGEALTAVIGTVTQIRSWYS